MAAVLFGLVVQYISVSVSYLSESLADVEQSWSSDWVSEVRGRKQQCRHLQVNQLETTNTHRLWNSVIKKKKECPTLVFRWTGSSVLD